MTDVERARRALGRAQLVVHGCRQNLLIAYRDQQIKCHKCTQDSALKLWSFIQTGSYVNYGGMRGDEYTRHGAEDCYLRCPACHEQLHIYWHPQKPAILAALKDYTKEQLFYEAVSASRA